MDLFIALHLHDCHREKGSWQAERQGLCAKAFEKEKAKCITDIDVKPV
jgi:hypothetical protein